MLQHPFVKETEEEKKERKVRTEQYNKWAAREHPSGGNSDSDSPFTVNIGDSEADGGAQELDKTINPSFEYEIERSPESESTMIIGENEVWLKYEKMARTEKGATTLRHDSNFYDRVISVLHTETSDLHSDEKVVILHICLRVISLVLQNSKLQDQDTDILKSSSIPTLLTSNLKVVFKKGEEFPETLAYLVRATSLLIKPTYTSTIGIDPMLIKGLLILIPSLLKINTGEPSKNMLLHSITLNTVGKFLSQTAISPGKMVHIYKEIVDTKVLEEACKIIKKISGTPDKLQKSAIQVVSTAVHPFYGEVYSFPWQRGPHSAVLEYNENMVHFELLRETICHALNSYKWTGKLTIAYKEYFDDDNVM